MRNTTTTLLVCILAVLLLTAGGVAAGVWSFAREAEFKRDKERIEEIDRAVSAPFSGVAVAHTNQLIREQNALVRKWEGRLPGRTERRQLPVE